MTSLPGPVPLGSIRIQKKLKRPPSQTGALFTGKGVPERSGPERSSNGAFRIRNALPLWNAPVQQRSGSVPECFTDTCLRFANMDANVLYLLATRRDTSN
jgi:hypothetical protein